MLNWSEEQFLNSSLKHLMKQIDIHMKINNPNSEANHRRPTSENDVSYQIYEVLD